MAEAAVNLVVNRLVSLLDEEAKVLKGVHTQVEEIKCELESIQSFLKDADAKANQGSTSEGFKTWVKQSGEVAYRIEDAVDDYIIIRVAHHRHRGFISFLNKVTHLIKKLKAVRHIYAEIEDIKVSLQGIKERSQSYRLNTLVEGSSAAAEDDTWIDPCIGSLFTKEFDLVGINSPKSELIKLLNMGKSKRVVLSIVGMGGLGKTTLAKKVYESQISTEDFHCHAWITVSQLYKVEKLLWDMLTQFYKTAKKSAPSEIDSMQVRLLIETLQEFLEEMRYLIIVDDVWKIDVWECIKHALPSNDKGSRIIITSRSEDVASFSREFPCDHIYRLQPLLKEDAMKLFCKKAFTLDFGGSCPPKLEKLSVDIVKKCEGLPLALVAIGGLLSTKMKIVSEWQKLHDSLGTELESNPRLTGIKKILSLSYYDLPYYLKPCLLYFGMFPEDYFISQERLIRLLLSEGFVEEKKGKSLEEVAKEYLMELIQRSLVQAVGEYTRYGVHDLMHEIILSKSKELSFSQVQSGEKSSCEGSTRRLSIHNGRYDLAETTGNYRIRSLLLFKMEIMPNMLTTMLCQNFQLLKVMDFQDAPLDQLPRQVGNLIHLRYLNMSYTKIKVVPASLGNLYNLQTLDLRNTLVHELPFKIQKLQKLRHLLVFEYPINDFKFGSNISFNSYQGVKIQGSIGCLEALQEMEMVEANSTTGLIAELGKMWQLKVLAITKVRGEDISALCSAIDNMNHLEDLTVHMLSENEVLDLQNISCPPWNLRNVLFFGRLTKFPNWIPELDSLERVTLYFSRLRSEPLKTLQALPNLSVLRMYKAYEGEQLHFEATGFQKLKILVLRSMEELRIVTIDGGSMPHLKYLDIGPAPRLKELPSGIQHLTNLQDVTFLNMHKKFVYRMLPDEGPDYWKVKHIPTVSFTCQIEDEGKDFKFFTLDEPEELKQLYS